MIYKNFKDIKLSHLGIGAMRLPTIGEGFTAPIDEKHAGEMIDYAYKSGVNYYDTAYLYHNEKSEEVLGKLLKKYPRESYYLADKFPGYDLVHFPHVEKIFEKQLQRCDVDYFDFYLLHNVCELNLEQYFDVKFGIMDHLRKQKKAGRIKYLGFSAHARLDTMKKFLEVYGSEMEYCQLQINYLDWTLQEAKEKVELLKSYNIPVWVMEPMRGGKLASLSDENTAKLKALRPTESVGAWAFRFLQTIPDMIMILTGASSLEQLKENVTILSENKPLSDKEMSVLTEVANSMLNLLPCTACRYCIPHRTCNIDIPTLLFMYNDLCTINGFITHMGIGALPKDERPSACTACGQCEAVCPQQIEISKIMTDFVEKMKQPMDM